MDDNNLRTYKAGDLIKITGFNGRIFGNGHALRFNDGFTLGTQCILMGDERTDGDVLIPNKIFKSDSPYISIACIELVTSVEELKKINPYKLIHESEDDQFQILCGNKIVSIHAYGKDISQEQAYMQANYLYDQLVSIN